MDDFDRHVINQKRLVDGEKECAYCGEQYMEKQNGDHINPSFLIDEVRDFCDVLCLCAYVRLALSEDNFGVYYNELCDSVGMEIPLIASYLELERYGGNLSIDNLKPWDHPLVQISNFRNQNQLQTKNRQSQANRPPRFHHIEEKEEMEIINEWRGLVADL